MKNVLVSVLMLVSLGAQAQFREHCPSFKIQHQRSGMHYELKKFKKYRPEKYPVEGIVVFTGGYIASDLMGFGTSLRVQMVEFGISAGWDVRHTNTNLFKKKENGTAYVNAFGLTLGKYYTLGDRGLIDVGVGYGHSAHSGEVNELPFFGYGLASYRVWRNVWVSGSVHVTDFKSPPYFGVGLATLIW